METENSLPQALNVTVGPIVNHCNPVSSPLRHKILLYKSILILSCNCQSSN